jgi:hypothetical protein
MGLMIPIPDFKTLQLYSTMLQMLRGNLACSDTAWLTTLRLLLFAGTSVLRGHDNLLFARVMNDAFEALRHIEDPTFLSLVCTNIFSGWDV